MSQAESGHMMTAGSLLSAGGAGHLAGGLDTASHHGGSSSAEVE